MRNHTLVFAMSLLLGSCISVQLPGGKATSAQDVEYKAPPAPYKDIATSKSDKAWISSETGNTLSYLSECSVANEPSLQQMENESLSAMTHVQVLKMEEITFNGRAARLSVTKGSVDGVPVQISLLVFKKNGCNYTLSYGGLEKNFSHEEKFFDSFKESFKAP